MSVGSQKFGFVVEKKYHTLNQGHVYINIFTLRIIIICICDFHGRLVDFGAVRSEQEQSMSDKILNLTDNRRHSNG